MLLSIVIPTKDRYDTLLVVVNKILEIDSDNFEIVIQDNSFRNEYIIDVLSNLNDPRISYFYSTDPLSQTENSDLAVLNSKGKYVCFIGDDDIIMPYIIDVVNWMSHNNISVIKSYKPDYYWPGLPSTSTSNNRSGLLTYKEFEYKFSSINCHKALIKTLKHGGTSIDFLPSLYHGIVSSNVLKEVYVKANSYFPGPSPDMASAVAISLVVNEFVYLEIPIIISGKSMSSIGGLGVIHKHVRDLNEVKHLPQNTVANWNVNIPKIWTGETIWSQSIYESLKRMNSESYFVHFSFSYLYASLFLFNFRYSSLIFKTRKHLFSFNFYISLIKIFTYRVLLFIRNRITLFDLKRVDNLSTISEASNFVFSKIENKLTPWR
jgi:glycosyltransferase involved in cell wall biosynthesis